MVIADKVLSEVQLHRLLKKLNIEKDKAILALKVNRTPQDTRIVMDYFLFTLLAHTGLRISEALNLSWNDIHDDFLIIRAELSKNKRKGNVYFGPKTKKIINDLTKIKRETLKSTNTNLIFSLNGKVPSRSYAHTRFKYWLSQSSLPSGLSIHSLRHTYGTLCLDKGLSLTFVRDQLRHSNISITSQYLHLTKANRDKVKDLF